MGTYFDIEYADTLVKSLFKTNSDERKLWDALVPEDRQILINEHSDIINNCMFIGYKVNVDSSLQFPRYINCRVVECPEDIKKAIVSNALIKENRLSRQETKYQELGVEKLTTEGSSISFDLSKRSNMYINGIDKEIYNKYIRKWCY